VVTIIYLLRPHAGVLLGLTVFSYVLLIPSCRCYNPPNRAWIDLLGLSPTCFAAPFAAGMMVIGAAVSHRRLLATAVIGWTIASGLLGFHVGHHYFHWPW
jgi:hypothetical protein